MSPQSVFGLQFLSSLLVISLLSKWLVAPWLARHSRSEALFWLTLPHAFRGIGAVFLGAGVLGQGLPGFFTIPTLYGGLITSVLALLALVFLRLDWKGAVAAVWLFNIVGTIDLLNIVRHAEANFGAARYIPTLLVPLLLVTHVMIFDRLPKRAATPENSTPK